MSYRNNETSNRWTTDCCTRCGQAHYRYVGRADNADSFEYVYTVCRGVSEPIPVTYGQSDFFDISLPPTIWRLDRSVISL